MRIVPEYSKSQNAVYRWLLTGCVLIVLMVVIGGITRLTQSGLSMVKWEPIMGTIPPLSDKEWNEVFELYKQSPEYLHYNTHFTLSDFKSIYFWEYLHRLIARIIGLIFIIPCVIFWIKGYFSPRLKKQVLIIFALGAFQGVLGWVMVKSGLVERPHVSHYRLAAHLITALGLMVYIFWVAMTIKFEVISESKPRIRQFVKWIIAIIVLQLIYGAFVAGLKAGLMYNTFPKMGSEWIPSSFSSTIKLDGFSSIFESGGIVQFIHRIIAYIIVVFVLVIAFKSKKEKLSPMQQLALTAMVSLVIVQCTLGIFTVLYVVPVFLGVLHQFVAILLLIASFFFLYTLTTSKKPQYISI